MMPSLGHSEAEHVSFNGTRGFCKLCNIELTSLQHKKQHVDGKQHNKKSLTVFKPGQVRNDIEPISGSNQGITKCTVCNVTLYDKKSINEHFHSESHRISLQRARWDSDYLSSNNLSSNEILKPIVYCESNYNPRAEHETSGDAHLQSTLASTSDCSDKKSSSDVVYNTGSSVTLKFEWECCNERGFCDVCDKIFLRRDDWFDHFKSQGHRKMEEEVKKERCWVCNEQYGNPGMAKKHLNSTAHRKKVQDLIQTQSHKLGKFYNKCHDSSQIAVSGLDNTMASSTCENIDNLREQVSCDTTSPCINKMHPPSLDVIKDSVFRHDDINMLERSLNPLSIEAIDACKSMASVNIAPSVCAEEDRVCERRPISFVDTPYVFGGTCGKCNLCNVNLTSNLHAQSHLSGSKHQKAERQWQSSRKQTDLAAGQSSQIQPTHDHSAGSGSPCVFGHADGNLEAPGEHKGVSRINTMSVDNGLSAPLGSKESFGSVKHCLPRTPEYFTGAGNWPVSHSPNMPVCLTSEPKTSSVMAPQNQPVVVMFDGSKWYCNACKIDLNSDQHRQQHVDGRKHHCAVDRMNKSNNVTGCPIECEICHKPFSSVDNATQHFSSKKHQQRLELLTDSTSSHQQDPETGAILITKGDKTWFMCHVCKCMMNTLEQYRCHINSPRHKMQEEKCLSNGNSGTVQLFHFPQDKCVNQVGATSKTVPVTSIVQHPKANFSGNGMFGNSVPSYRQPSMESGSGYRNADLVQVPRSNDRCHDVNFASGVCTAERQQKQCQERILTAGPNDTCQSTSYDNNVTFADMLPSVSRNGSGSHCDGYSLRIPEKTLSSRRDFLPPMNTVPHNSKQAIALHLSHLSSGLPVHVKPSDSSGGCKSNAISQAIRMAGDYLYDANDDSISVLPVLSSSANYANNIDKVGNWTEDQKRDYNDISDRVDSCKGLSEYTTSNNMSVKTEPAHFLEALPGQNDQLPESRHSSVQSTKLFKGFRYGCEICNQPMNTEEDFLRHLKGLRHQLKVATVSAPECNDDAAMRQEVYSGNQMLNDAADDPPTPLSVIHSCCKTSPREYQVDLLCKAMASDSTVIYLPTGTGKTLVAVMTMSRMLSLNPTRAVLFLADKVLLVLQQARYIIDELGDGHMFVRSHLEHRDQLHNREVKTAILCGGLSVRDELPLWKYDVIVTTAAFCQNLLVNGVLRWSNFSMVVLDEVHHCTKNHPYNRLLSDHHLSLEPGMRPKLLGLTASPAGQSTKEETLHMLQALLKNLGRHVDLVFTVVGTEKDLLEQKFLWMNNFHHLPGGASFATPTEVESCSQLEMYTSSARLIPTSVPMTEAELGFHKRLLVYFILAFVELMLCSSLQSVCSSPRLRVLLAARTECQVKADDEVVLAYAGHLLTDPDELNDLVQLVQTARVKVKVVSEHLFDRLRAHVMGVGMALLNSEDGIQFVFDDLERLFNNNLNQHCDLNAFDLPLQDITTYVTTLIDMNRLSLSEKGVAYSLDDSSGLQSDMSIFRELMMTLANTHYISWQESNAMALVLVRERKLAHKFKEHLQQTAFVRERAMKVAVVVGHGSGGGEGEGMNLRKQDKVLCGIKAGQYSIVVATSVAEEGLDIPVCQLVVTLNPPSTVKALVQMRGRARKKGSFFVVLCSSEYEKNRLLEMQKHELNMKWAATQLSMPSVSPVGVCARSGADDRPPCTPVCCHDAFRLSGTMWPSVVDCSFGPDANRRGSGEFADGESGHAPALSDTLQMSVLDSTENVDDDCGKKYVDKCVADCFDCSLLSDERSQLENSLVQGMDNLTLEEEERMLRNNDKIDRQNQ